MSRLGETPFGSPLRIVVAGLLSVALVIGGGFAVGVFGVPSVDGVENRFGTVTNETTVIETDLELSNPNPVGVRLGRVSVNYTVSMNGVRMAAGSRRGVAVPAGNSTLTLTTRLDNERIPAWWVTHVRDEEQTQLVVNATITSPTLGVTREFSVTRSIETDLLGAFASTETRPVNADVPLVSDPVLYVNETDARWGTPTTEETPLDATFTVYNPKPIPYAISEIGYEVYMNDVRVGAGTTEEPYALPPKTETDVGVGAVIRNAALDEWWVSHLQNDQRTALRIDFYARLDLGGGQTVRVPLDELTYRETIETNIFGTDGSDTGSNGDTRSSGSESTATTASSSRTTTSPTSASEGPETDDGLLGGATPTDAPSDEVSETPTGAETPTPTDTPTDGDGLLGGGDGTDTPTDGGGLLGGGNETTTETDDGPYDRTPVRRVDRDGSRE